MDTIAYLKDLIKKELKKQDLSALKRKMPLSKITETLESPAYSGKKYDFLKTIVEMLGIDEKQEYKLYCEDGEREFIKANLNEGKKKQKRRLITEPEEKHNNGKDLFNWDFGDLYGRSK